ncbi:hypothetical protein AB0M28_13015 [Streptomyces sp. NPDC051940]|uniref:hypothetical protein n=1 Tax=Streptomyces sp. NPDC051940 TaxID=3155675 RepID=UPI00342EFA75
MTLTVVDQGRADFAQPWTLGPDGGRTPGAESEDRRRALWAGLQAAGCRSVTADASDADLDDLLGAVHQPEYLGFLDDWSRRLGPGELHVPHERTAPGVPQDTPLSSGILGFAREGARTALTAAALVAANQGHAYALCRPPGHHAGPDWSGGYCFLNNASVAAEALTRHGRRPGILDLDFHIGNGTAAVAQHLGDLPYASVHAATDRHYPWQEDLPGVDPRLCVGLPTGPTPEQYCTFVDMLAGRLADEGVDTLVLSLGFDVIKDDPHGGWELHPADLQLVAGLLAGRGWPVLVVQEGGYLLDELAACSASFARGLRQEEEM